MKWELKEPCFGDIIKVKAGTFYHYGIYVSDDEVIQFGLSPLLRVGTPDTDIEVCISDVDKFLVGGFLEVGVPEKKDEKRFAPKKTVELARSRIGEKGYHILYNNCEHFASECFYGKKYSSQTENVRELFRNLPVADVYVAPIPQSAKFDKLYPKARQSEIKSVSNPNVQKEKYFVWKLLEYALNKSFAKRITDVKFEKCESGKWVCDACEFSLSHSHDLVCVALSKAPIGVDIEKIQQTRIDLSKEILTEDEYSHYVALTDEEKVAFLINCWTKKESLFKRENQKPLSREAFKQLCGEVHQKEICINNDKYSLSIATNTPEKIKIFENIDLLN